MRSLHNKIRVDSPEKSDGRGDEDKDIIPLFFARLESFQNIIQGSAVCVGKFLHVGDFLSQFVFFNNFGARFRNLVSVDKINNKTNGADIPGYLN